jgi:hypothetical protein
MLDIGIEVAELALARRPGRAPPRLAAFLLEHDLIRKPVPIPDQAEDMLFGIML